MESKENEAQIETAEELEAEKGQLTVPKEDELRSSIISEYGFDAEADKERIDKLVAKELDHRIKLSKTIGQKIGYRNKLQAAKVEPPKAPETKVDEKDIDARVDSKLEQRDLDAMDYPDDIKKVIKNVAEINKVSVRKAVSDPYVADKIAKWRKDQGADEAAISRKNNSGSSAVSDLSTPPDVDLSTEEGRKQYDKWKADNIRKEKSQRGK